MNISISHQSKIRLDQMFDESRLKNKIFRVYIRRVSRWYGPVFDVALDEPTNTDSLFKDDPYEIIIDSDLASNITSIEILYKPGISKSGFRVNTNLVWKSEYSNRGWIK